MSGFFNKVKDTYKRAIDEITSEPTKTNRDIYNSTLSKVGEYKSNLTDKLDLAKEEIGYQTKTKKAGLGYILGGAGVALCVEHAKDIYTGLKTVGTKGASGINIPISSFNARI